MIKTGNISKKKIEGGKVCKVLNNISLKINKDEFIALIGPSESGKSSLIKILGLMDHSYDGSYTFEGNSMESGRASDIRKTRREAIGFITDKPNLLDELTVYENIELPLLYLKKSHNTRKQQIQKISELLNIDHLKHHLPSELSVLQQHKIALARALVTNPRLLLADDPLKNLSPIESEEIMKILSTVNNEGTTVIVTAKPGQVESYASRIIHIQDGGIITDNIGNRLNVKFKRA